LAAGWKNAGSTLDLGEPDIRLSFGKTTFLVECKRPFSAGSVRSNIEDAAQQLAKSLEQSGQADCFGVIAVSLNRAFSSGNRVCSAPEGLGRATINDALIELIDQHKREWKWSAAKLHPRVAAVMFHLTVPWDIGGAGERLIHLSTDKFLDTGKCAPGFSALRENVSRLYPAA
jgi:hypothetical protein